METRVIHFYSDGLRLDGLLQLPRGADERARRPVVLLCSGYLGLKELIPARFWGPLTDAGYACIAFDYRGFGTSEGERGTLIPQEQVEDVRNAVSYVDHLPGLDPDRVSVLGWGFGGGVVVQAAAEDRRIRAVACLNGIGNAGRAVRVSGTYSDWLAMQDRIAADRRQRVITGCSQEVSPWDVVPLDPATRAGVDARMYACHDRFGVEISLRSAEAYYAFRPEDVVDRISPRPLLIVHGARNELHPIAEARALFARAKEPKTLIEIPEGQHLDWIEPESPLRDAVMSRVVEWLLRAVPVEAGSVPVEGTGGIASARSAPGFPRGTR